MRILHITGEITRARGGPVTALQALVELWHQLGHHQTILAVKGRTEEATFPAHTTLKRFPGAWPFSFMRSPEAITWLKKEVGEFDLVVVHEIWPLLVIDSLRLLSRQATPYVIVPHASLDPDICYGRKAWLKRYYIATVLRSAIGRAASIWAASQMEAERLLRFGQSTPVALVPIPVALPANQPDRVASRQQEGWKEGEFVVLFVGRFHHVKGLDLLIEALRQASPKAPNLRLVLAGGGAPDLEAELRQQASTAGVGGSVTFAGFVDAGRRAALLAGADLFVLPSERENFGIAVVEALQARLPVLLTPHVGIAPTVVAAEAGWVCERTPRALAEHLVRLAGAPAKMTEAAVRARELALTFAPDAVSKIYVERLAEASRAASARTKA